MLANLHGFASNLKLRFRKDTNVICGSYRIRFGENIFGELGVAISLYAKLIMLD